MRAYFKAKFSVLFAIVIMLSFIFVTLITVGEPFSDTILSINPASQTVNAGDNFTIDVFCNPGKPIKAYEFRLSFDETLLRADSVVEGDIFANYTTFFNGGTINNSSGTIVDVYCLIVGPGNVSNNGTFVTISFSAKEYSGTSMLEFIDVGSWTGVTDETGYVPITVNSGSVEVIGGISPPSPPPSGGGGGGGFPPPPVYEENNPPSMPLKPSGPTFVEMGVEYIYSSSAIDVDGDQIRLRFDWGDGNLSEWSEFVDSNTTVSMSHNWSQILTYSVRVIAQDIDGLNSSWSPALNVTVSQGDFGIPPVVIIDIFGSFSVNETIIFDATGSYDLDGYIVSYDWDFGDGDIGSGINVSHLYKNPGEYTVTLIVSDNNGTTYSKSIIVNVAYEHEDMGSEEWWMVLPFNILMLIFGSVISAIVCLAIVFRDRITISLLNYQIRRIDKKKNKFSK